MKDPSSHLGKLTSWIRAPAALEKLATFPLEAKRAKVYPKVVKLAAEYWSDKKKGGSGLEVQNFVKFIVAELAVEPDLASQVFTALAARSLQVRPEHFYTLVAHSRDVRAVPLMKGLSKTYRFQWERAALALNAKELADDVAALLESPSYDMELPLAAGILGGSAFTALQKHAKSDFVSREDMVALGLALGGHDDETYFKNISRARGGMAAKRFHTALHAPKPKARLEAVDDLEKQLDRSNMGILTGVLLGFSRLLLSDDAKVVERAAPLFMNYLEEMNQNVRGQPEPWHAYFLECAQATITRGVSKKTRATLDEIRQSVPHCSAFKS